MTGTTPRLLAIMGSGETSPTMVRAHRDLLSQVGPDPVPAVLLDTPFGFQGNADDLTLRAQNYFRESLGQRLVAASFRSASEVGGLEHEQAMARLGEARYVFAGPGSPTYALRQWRQSSVPAILREKLAAGGCVTFASAAAITLGAAVVPVYEIYKVGAEATWEEGLDLLAEAGLGAAVVPHYNNAEGGTHDTRFCYLGEDRLAMMEEQLPAGVFVLGVDEHTGLVLDLGAGSATVVGLGAVTVRARGVSTELATGTETTIAHLAVLGTSGAVGVGAGAQAPATAVPAPPGQAAPPGPLLGSVAGCEGRFAAALGSRDISNAVRALLDLESDLHAWSADSLDSDQLDRGRAALRSMAVRLGEVAVGGARDPREVVGPFVNALLEVRDTARAAGRYADADGVRSALVSMGVEVRDSPTGTDWSLKEQQ